MSLDKGFVFLWGYFFRREYLSYAFHLFLKIKHVTVELNVRRELGILTT